MALVTIENENAPRAFTDGLHEAIAEGHLDWETLALSCLHWMSEADVRAMCEGQDDLEDVVGV